MAIQAEKKGLNLGITIKYSTPEVIIGDPGRIRQILVNLLSNAIKFTDKGGVSVSISSQVIQNNKREILFEVRDTGIGIPKDKMGRLFQHFSQLEYNISHKRDGAGLGLVISKRLVELMGGRIWVDSIPGEGSTFSFAIPAEAVPGRQLDLGEMSEESASINLSDQKPMAILVAEDNLSNQKVLVEMLKKFGYRPDAVADGKEVLQALELRPYDLVLMDIKMPEMDGITAAREIRKLWLASKQPKIVAITAFAMEGDREKCLEAGMDDYIAKPVQKKELMAILMKYSPEQNTES
ncbi:MAG TPA: ATP-binding protein [Methanotrichaceae archaeon]|nr:ATP-binding protein [Methanotrichaceae archaeon]